MGGGGTSSMGQAPLGWYLFFPPPWSSEIAATMSMQNTIFDLHHNWFYSFFSGRGRVPIYILETATGELEGKMKIGNPVKKLYICSSIIALIFGFFMIFRGSDMYLEKLEQPCKKAVFMLLFPREIQGIYWENGNFLIWSQIIVLNLVCSIFLVNKGKVDYLYLVSVSVPLKCDSSI